MTQSELNVNSLTVFAELIHLQYQACSNTFIKFFVTFKYFCFAKTTITRDAQRSALIIILKYPAFLATSL